MDVEPPDSHSTYGVLTAQRILERFKISLDQEVIGRLMANSTNLYFQFLRIPMKQVLHGIIFQQAYDYQVYAQKLFVDFLLSGQDDKDKNSPGASNREELEEERTHLIKLSELFSQKEVEHAQLISETQNALIHLSHELQALLHDGSETIKKRLALNNIHKSGELINKAFHFAIIAHKNDQAFSDVLWENLQRTLEISIDQTHQKELDDLANKIDAYQSKVEQFLRDYLDPVEAIGNSLRHYRNDFYETVLKVTELIKQLPDYHPNEERETKNRANLYFDSKLGEQ